MTQEAIQELEKQIFEQMTKLSELRRASERVKVRDYTFETIEGQKLCLVVDDATKSELLPQLYTARLNVYVEPFRETWLDQEWPDVLKVRSKIQHLMADLF